ncbi:uncharacterized protein F5147DRAFT_656965 [Suillus discolor]|uniref:Uncharacterized protein n=1 Tax=Suillus discolor TaxID=1912936 RepID=A0A9P7EWK8_9AGAM|nr:uncharacterized protein F5147DRAFT_656965 [Suillus discolor]KAG2095319.1 hypothetical protein F5147DRAFT_656965 [Suillus discolor]
MSPQDAKCCSIDHARKIVAERREMEMEMKRQRKKHRQREKERQRQRKMERQRQRQAERQRQRQRKRESAEISQLEGKRSGILSRWRRGLSNILGWGERIDGVRGACQGEPSLRKAFESVVVNVSAHFGSVGDSQLF